MSDEIEQIVDNADAELQPRDDIQNWSISIPELNLTICFEAESEEQAKAMCIAYLTEHPEG